MNNNRKALGRGLEQLFSAEKIDLDDFEEKIVNDTPVQEVLEIELADLRSNPYQPRKTFEPTALTELANSIKEYGVVQPIIVKQTLKGYEIVAGERRARASMEAGFTKIPAIVKQFTDEEMMEIALLENLQRENLNAIEEAQAYQALIHNLNITQDALSQKMGKSRSHVTNIIGLLRLPQITQQLVVKGDISMAHARILSKLESKEQVLELSDRIIKEGMSVRKLEQVSSDISKRVTIKPRSNQVDHKYDQVVKIMSDMLDAKVTIKEKKLTINFNSENDLKRILDILNIKE